MKLTPSSSSQSTDGVNIYDIPKATRHDFALAGGNNLSYYTFDTGPSTNENPRPVLYFHGFPGCGLEGAVCASEVADADGKLYALDRPGFGHSDAYDPSLSDPDEQVQAFVNGLWEFIQHENWETFSVIAVSGGGPFAMAFLSFFLEKRADSRDSSLLPKLEAVSLVACVCCSAGTEGMMKENKSIFNLVQSQDKLSSSLGLTLMFAVPSLFIKILPSRLLMKMAPTKNLPPADKECFFNPQVSNYMVSVATLALGQSYTAALNEAKIIFRRKQGFENSLKRRYKQPSDDYPRIAIYQGTLDVNVPKSHATFIYEDQFRGTPNFVEYPELGHLSLVVDKANEYSRFALGVASSK